MGRNSFGANFQLDYAQSSQGKEESQQTEKPDQDKNQKISNDVQHAQQVFYHGVGFFGMALKLLKFDLDFKLQNHIFNLNKLAML